MYTDKGHFEQRQGKFEIKTVKTVKRIY